jgi:hypothetical protein
MDEMNFGGMNFESGADFGGGGMSYGDAMNFGHDTTGFDSMYHGDMGDHTAAYEGFDFNATDFGTDATGFGGGENTMHHDLHATDFTGYDATNNNDLSEITVANGPVNNNNNNNNNNNEHQASDYFAAFANGASNGFQSNKPNKPHKPNKPNKAPKPNQLNTLGSTHTMPAYTYATVPGVAGTAQPYMMAVPVTTTQQQSLPTIYPMMSPVSHAGVGSNIQYGLKPPQTVQPMIVTSQLGHSPHKPMIYPVNVGINNMTIGGNLGGGCLNGMPHSWVKEYTAVGLVLAVCLFPFGLICCQSTAYLQCTRCHQTKKD